MRKKIILFLIIAMIAGSGQAFAQLANGNYIGASGNFSFMPLELQLVHEPAAGRDRENDLKAAQGQWWGGTYGRLVLFFRGQHNFIGYEAQFLTDDGILQLDLANAWVKPFDWMKLTIGRFADATLRGRVLPNEFHYTVLRAWSRTANLDAQDVIFNFNSSVTGGAQLALTPIYNLYIGLTLPGVFSGFPVDSTSQVPGGETAKNIYSNIQAAAGYTLDGIGLIRAQYVGKPEFEITRTMAESMYLGQRYSQPVYTDLPRFELAFAYTGLDDMVIDLGFKFAPPPMSNFTLTGGGGTLKTTYNPGYVFGLGLRMNMGNFALIFNGSGHFGNSYKAEAAAVTNEYSYGMNMNFHLMPQYNLGFGFVGMNLGIDITGKEKINGTDVAGTGRTDFGIGAWFSKHLAPGCAFWAGLSYTYKGVEGYGARQPDQPSGYIRIPIIIQAWFF